jgi:hypothetical protein
MKGQLCRIFLFLSLAILVVCLPAQAAQSGQSGLSSPVSDHGAQINTSSGMSADTTSESVGKISGTDTQASPLPPAGTPSILFWIHYAMQ